MFKRDVKSIKDIVLEKRRVDSWHEVGGEMIARDALDVDFGRQPLVVRMSSPALRQELSMRRDYYVELLNNKVGAKVIYNIRFC